MEGGLVSQPESGVPQGGPLSPLLSNIYLDELDRELEHRGHHYTRYADDCQIYVKSARSGKRVLSSITRFIEKRMKLKVNQEKSTSDKSSQCSFLGYICYRTETGASLSISKRSIARFKAKIRKLTVIRGGRSFRDLIQKLRPLLMGWSHYYGLEESRWTMRGLDGWIRRRLRACAYSLLKTGQKRYAFFRNSGVRHEEAYKSAYSSRGTWHNSRCLAMQQALSNRRLETLGYYPLRQRV